MFGGPFSPFHVHGRLRTVLITLQVVVFIGILLVTLFGCSGSAPTERAVPPDAAGASDGTTTTSVRAHPNGPPRTRVTTTTLTAAEADLRAVYDRWFVGYWDCVQAPADCVDDLTVPDSLAARELDLLRLTLGERDRHITGGQVGPGYLLEEVRVGPDGDEAVVRACWWANMVLQGAPVDLRSPVGPDNPYTLVGTMSVVQHRAETFRRVGDRWLLHRIVYEEGTREVATATEAACTRP